MKKRVSLIILAIVVLLAVIIPANNVLALNKDVLTLDATQENGKITVSGTVEHGMLAVSVQVFDENGTKVALTSGAIDTQDKFNVVIDLPEGNYTIEVADYDSGTIKSTTVTASNTVITEMNVTLKAPVIGDKVTTTEVNNVKKQNNTPVYTAEDGANYTIGETRWIKGTFAELGAEFEEPISTTFEADKYYYAAVEVTAKTGYVFSPTLDIKVNGEAPAEVLGIYAGSTPGSLDTTSFIVKIKAVEKAEEAAEEATSTTPKTGDIIMTFVAIFAVSVVCYVAIVIKKRSTKLNSKH